MFRFLYALDPFSITEEKEKALNVALEYFDRIFGTDTYDHEKVLLASYDYRDTHEYPKAAEENEFVYLIKGSPNRGLAIVRNLGRIYSITIDSFEGTARIYVLKDPSRIDAFRSKAYKDFLVSQHPTRFKTGRTYVKYEGFEILMHLGVSYSRVTLRPSDVNIRPIEQRRPVDVVRNNEELTFAVPTFAVPFAVFDILEGSEKTLLARLVREVYGF